MDCLHCRATRAEVLLRFREQATYRCRICRGYFNEPVHGARGVYVSRYYDKVYAPRKGLQLKASRRYLKILGTHLALSSVLDYGCGAGAFLVAAEGVGISEIVGADTSRDAVEIARRNLGDRVSIIHLDAEPLPPRRFDAIVLLDTISALPDPRGTLEHLRDHHLAERGVIAIRTPLVSPRYFVIVRWLAPFIGRKQASRLMFAENRYALFDERALRRLLASLGFRPVFEEVTPDYPPLETTGHGWRDGVMALVQRLLRVPVIFLVASASVRSYHDAASSPAGPDREGVCAAPMQRG